MERLLFDVGGNILLPPCCAERQRINQIHHRIRVHLVKDLFDLSSGLVVDPAVDRIAGGGVEGSRVDLRAVVVAVGLEEILADRVILTQPEGVGRGEFLRALLPAGEQVGIELLHGHTERLLHLRQRLPGSAVGRHRQRELDGIGRDHSVFTLCGIFQKCSRKGRARRREICIRLPRLAISGEDDGGMTGRLVHLGVRGLGCADGHIGRLLVIHLRGGAGRKLEAKRRKKQRCKPFFQFHRADLLSFFFC